MNKNPASLEPRQHAADPIAHNLVQALLPALQEPEKADTAFVEHVIRALTAHVARHYGNAENAAGLRLTQAMPPWQLRRAKEYMAGRLAQDLTLEDVAQACGMSRSHFARSFKKSTGMAPFEWMRHERVERAKQMLAAGEAPLICIAVECGFTDQSHFTRVFTRLAGVSPSAWRKAARR